jgi:hypothetical protein
LQYGGITIKIQRSFRSDHFWHQLSHVSDYRWGLDWWMDLLTTYTQHSELQVITAVSLISTPYKSPQHPLSLFPACCVFISHSLVAGSDSGDSSVSRS